jgi:hypothetical protein
VPFVVSLHNGLVWGLFVDSSYRLEFDLVNSSADVAGLQPA